MKAKLTVEMDNAAFEDGPELELARILRFAADRLEANGLAGVTLRDVNGNTVGKLTVS